MAHSPHTLQEAVDAEGDVPLPVVECEPAVVDDGEIKEAEAELDNEGPDKVDEPVDVDVGEVVEAEDGLDAEVPDDEDVDNIGVAEAVRELGAVAVVEDILFDIPSVADCPQSTNGSALSFRVVASQVALESAQCLALLGPPFSALLGPPCSALFPASGRRNSRLR